MEKIIENYNLFDTVALASIFGLRTKAIKESGTLAELKLLRELG